MVSRRIGALMLRTAASRTPLPACVLAAGEAAVRRKAATPWDIGDTEAQKEEVRTLFGELLGGGASGRVASLQERGRDVSRAHRPLYERE